MNADGRAQSNMGVAIGDFDHRGRIGVLTTTFFHDYFPFFQQDAGGFFDEIAAPAGMASATKDYLGWACGFADFDNDGQKDLWLANGHVYPLSPNYNQPVTILRNQGGQFKPVFALSRTPNNSYRGGCGRRFRNDGRIDVAVVPIAGSPLLLHNESRTRTTGWACTCAARKPTAMRSAPPSKFRLAASLNSIPSATAAATFPAMIRGCISAWALQ